MGAAEENMVLETSKDMLPACKKLGDNSTPDIATVIPEQNNADDKSTVPEKVDKPVVNSADINADEVTTIVKKLKANGKDGKGPKESRYKKSEKKDKGDSKKPEVPGERITGAPPLTEVASDTQVPIPVVTGVSGQPKAAESGPNENEGGTSHQPARRREATSEYGDQDQGGRHSRRFVPGGMPRGSRSYHGSTGQLRLTRRSTGGSAGQYQQPYSGSQPGLNREQPRIDVDFGFRFVMPKAFVSQFIGSRGTNIKGLVTRSLVKSIFVDKDSSAADMQAVNVFGHPANCDLACEEILKFLYRQSTGREADASSHLRLEMLIEDIYCGLLIGRHGRTIHELREGTMTRISVSKLLYDEKFISFYPERVMFISGTLQNVIQAQAEVSRRQFAMRSRARDNVFYQTAGGARRQVYNGPAMLGHLICDIYISNTQAGAIIGRSGEHIKQVMNISQALVSVMPRRDDDSRPGRGERRVRIAGTHEALFRASYGVLLNMIRYMPSRPTVDSYDLDLELLIPATTVGHIIGKRGRRVRQMESRTGAFIHMGNCSGCSPAPTGTGRTRVGIRGNFWQAQKAISLIWEVVQNVDERCAVPPSNFQRSATAAARRASVANLRELRYSQSSFDPSSSGPGLGQGAASVQQPESQPEGLMAATATEVAKLSEEETRAGGESREAFHLDEKIVSMLKAKVESTQELYAAGKARIEGSTTVIAATRPAAESASGQDDAVIMKDIEDVKASENQDPSCVALPSSVGLDETDKKLRQLESAEHGASCVESLPAATNEDEHDGARLSKKTGSAENASVEQVEKSRQPEPVKDEASSVVEHQQNTTSGCEPNSADLAGEKLTAVGSEPTPVNDEDTSAKEQESASNEQVSPSNNEQSTDRKLLSPDIKEPCPETKEQVSSSNDQGLEARNENSEVTEQGSEVKVQGSEAKEQRSEAKEQGSEAKEQGSEVMMPGSEVMMQGSEAKEEGTETNAQPPSSTETNEQSAVSSEQPADPGHVSLDVEKSLAQYSAEQSTEQIPPASSIDLPHPSILDENLNETKVEGVAESQKAPTENLDVCKPNSATDSNLDTLDDPEKSDNIKVELPKSIMDATSEEDGKTGTKRPSCLPTASLGIPKRKRKGKGDEGDSRKHRGSLSGSQSSGAPSPRTPTAPVELGGVSAEAVAEALTVASNDILSKSPQNEGN